MIPFFASSFPSLVSCVRAEKWNVVICNRIAENAAAYEFNEKFNLELSSLIKTQMCASDKKVFSLSVLSSASDSALIPMKMNIWGFLLANTNFHPVNHVLNIDSPNEILTHTTKIHFCLSLSLTLFPISSISCLPSTC